MDFPKDQNAKSVEGIPHANMAPKGLYARTVEDLPHARAVVCEDHPTNYQRPDQCEDLPYPPKLTTTPDGCDVHINYTGGAAVALAVILC